MPLRDLLLVLLVVATWGINFVFIRWGVEEVPPLFMTGLRYVAAALPAVFFVRRPNVPLGTLLAYGFAIGVAQFGLLFMAISLGMPSGLASLVMQLQAFFTFALAFVFLGERINRFQLLGAIIAFGGIAVIALERLEFHVLLPLLMCVASAFFWGLSNIVIKKAGRIDMFSFVVWSSLVPPLPLFALSFMIEGFGAVAEGLTGITGLGVASIAFNGYAATLVGFGLWSALLSRYPASTIAPFSLLVPVAGMISAAVLLGEIITGLEAWGSALVFAGLMVNVFGPRLLARARGA
ncbi:O-acetylserine/cysteine efflux transporter [Devosia lucknowensis]|uniref:O-acetylserine/cysteine efflux transporter n=1 Tax=Devosia lucknowensis TaxID=1096929 RepID=A0A1Y6GCA9_9HYPH|nr:EamA family transporter [Devosia lucknowensis]SMQ86127.1 O-acetylserine/cysteine efflux transporter [Devosia lucknowensis]